MWRDKVAGPTLRTYDAACDELGGEPWRELPEATDRWFLADRPKSPDGLLANAARPPTVDTASFDLRRHLSDGAKLALLAGAALVMVVAVVAALAHGSARAPSLSAVSSPPAAPTSQVAPIVTPAPAITPAAAVTPAPVHTIASAPAAILAPLAKRPLAHRRRR